MNWSLSNKLLLSMELKLDEVGTRPLWVGPNETEDDSGLWPAKVKVVVGKSFSRRMEMAVGPRFSSLPNQFWWSERKLICHIKKFCKFSDPPPGSMFWYPGFSRMILFYGRTDTMSPWVKIMTIYSAGARRVNHDSIFFKNKIPKIRKYCFYVIFKVLHKIFKKG